jgi:ketosteroid isomerase-like protein
VILARMASEESTTPDLVELSRRSQEAANRRDVDEAMSLFAPHAVWDISPMDLGVFQGRAAIRGFLEDWLRAYDSLAVEVEALLDLGDGVGLEVFTQRGRLTGSTGEVHQRSARVVRAVDGLTVRLTSYTDIDEARAAAERLAQERG